MKAIPYLGAFCALATTASAQTNVPLERSTWQPKARSEHQTEWSAVRHRAAGVNGEVRATIDSYIELATGLNKRASNGSWEPASADFRITPTGAEANLANHRVKLAPNINLSGSVEVELNGTKMQGHPLGIAYYDPVSGRSRLLGELKAARAWLISPTEIVYSNCFQGVGASIRFRNFRGGLEQDLILHEQFAVSPDELGFSDGTRLELYTEWVGETPLPQQKPYILEGERDFSLRSSMAEPDFTDTVVAFGALQMAAGRAFEEIGLTGGRGRYSASRSVGKRFEIIQGRRILIEAVTYKSVEAMLVKLPAHREAHPLKLAEATKPSSSIEVSGKTPERPVRVLPPKRPDANNSSAEFHTVGVTSQTLHSFPQEGSTVVLDWVLVPSANPQGYTFRGTNTYLISGPVTLGGDVTFEGGTVLKFGVGSSMASLQVAGNVICATSDLRPAILTSVNDNTIGQTLTGSTPNPVGAQPWLHFPYGSANIELKHFRFRSADSAPVAMFGPASRVLTIKHGQFVGNLGGIYIEGASLRLLNCLVDTADFVAGGYNFALEAEHVTGKTMFALTDDQAANPPHKNFKNCIFLEVGDYGVPAQNQTLLNSVFNPEEGPLFAPVMAGNFYLAPNTYQDAASSVHADLLSDFTRMTTHAPVVLTGVAAPALILEPTPIGDVGPEWDLGYHYPIIDYAVTLSVVDSSVLLTNGVVVTPLPTVSGVGFFLIDDASLISEGLPTKPNQLITFGLVQEQAVQDNSMTMLAHTFFGPDGTADIKFRFTSLDKHQNSALHFSDSGGQSYYPRHLTFRDCQFTGGNIEFGSSVNPGEPYELINNSFKNVNLWFYRLGLPGGAPFSELSIYNNVFDYSSVVFEGAGNCRWLVKDNVFYHSQLFNTGTVAPDHGHNAFVDCFLQGLSIGATDVPLTDNTFAFQQLLNRPYYPNPASALVDKGSRMAPEAGLYHHTTSVSSGSKEGASIVDIGIHYLAFNSSNQLLDTDGDGNPDYREDSDGGGSALLPISRRVAWEPGVTGGIPLRATGGVGGVNVLSFGADPNGVEDSRTAFQNAIDTCLEGQVVYVPAGRYKLLSGLTMKSGVTMRGAGRTRSGGPTETGATVIEYQEQENTGLFVILFQTSAYDSEFLRATPVELTGGYTKGSVSISTANNTWAPGDLVLIDELENNDLFDHDGNSGPCTWCGRDLKNQAYESIPETIRSHNQLVEIVSRTPNSITFWPPLHSDYAITNNPQGIWIEGPIRYAGIEDLIITNITGAAHTTIFHGAYKCWIKNCELAISKNRHVWMDRSLGCEFRDSSFHHGYGPDWSAPAYGSGWGYGVFLGAGSTACLVENNDFWKLHFAVAFEGGSSGNVVAYNFATDAMYFDPATPQPTLGNHASHPMMNLWEGNILRSKILMDTYWGGSSHTTLFRNRISNKDRNNCVQPEQYAFVLDIWKQNRYHNIIGNVLGTAGMEDALNAPTMYPRTGKYIYRIGFTEAEDNLIDDNDLTVEGTMIRHGNWTSTTTTTAGSPGVLWMPNIEEHTLPPSLYLTSKPVWWGTAPWPSVGSDLNPTEGSIPAQVRYNESQPGNSAPTISTIPDQHTSLGVSTGPIAFSIGDAQTPLSALGIVVSSSDQTLLPNANILLSGVEADRAVTLIPASGNSGIATVSITVCDGSLFATETFDLRVDFVEDFEGNGTANSTFPGFVNPGWAVDLGAGSINTVFLNDTSPTSTEAFQGTKSCVLFADPFGNTQFYRTIPGADRYSVSFKFRAIALSPNRETIIAIGDLGNAILARVTIQKSGTDGIVTALIGPGSGVASTVAVSRMHIGETYNVWVDYNNNENGSRTCAVGFSPQSMAPSGSDPNYAKAVLTPTDSSTDVQSVLFGNYGRELYGGSVTYRFDNIIIGSTTDPNTIIAASGNNPPTISDIPNHATTEDVSTPAINFTVGDVETSPGCLMIGAISDNPTLVPVSSIVFGGDGVNRTVTATPATNQSGIAMITVLICDGVTTSSDTFMLTVNAVNDPPTISDILSQTINEDASTTPLGVTVGDLETAVTSLTLTGSSSNPTLVPNGNIVFAGSGASRTVTITPVANQSGSATITVTVSDGSLTASDTCLITVNAVNDAPTVSDIANQTIEQNTSSAMLSFTIGDLETSATSLTVSRTSSNPTLVPTANIVLGGSGANRTVTVTPAANQTGTATITLTVSDGSLNVSDTFILTVNAASYLLNEGFEATASYGYDNTGWSESGAPNENYTTTVLHGAQSLNCSGAKYVQRTFSNSTNFNLYFRVRWITWSDYKSVVYWDDSNWSTVANIYGDDNRLQIKHGSVSANGTTTIATGTTYHVWVEWTKGTGSNGTMKLYMSTTGTKPASPEANITAGNGGATQRIYVGPTSAGPNVIFDRLLIDDAPIGANP